VRIVAYEANEWGVGEIWLEGDVLLYHELPTPVRAARERAGRWAGQARPLQERFVAYFGGGEVTFEDVELELDWCTPFQRAVLGALRSVPYGEAITYGELAALAGHPNAHRAAGTVCASNRFPIVVPCHRVVAAGSLGPYGATGTEYKRRLLALEGVAL
jgi:methylated-DNA-[protein]-cysteine S-methyltransferase